MMIGLTPEMSERMLLDGINRYSRLVNKNKASMALVEGSVRITKQMWDEELDTFIPTVILSMTIEEMKAVRKTVKDNLKAIDDFLVLAQALT